jgi:hypothetical protein
MNDRVGGTKKGIFWTYQHTYVNGVLTKTLHDAAITQIAFIKPDGSEDVLTYGGSDPRDSQLSRIAVGTFEWWYVTDVAGKWFLNERWSDTVSGSTVAVKGDPEPFLVASDPFGWVDKAAP